MGTYKFLENYSKFIPRKLNLKEETLERLQEPGGPFPQLLDIQIPSWCGKALLQEFDGEIDEEKMKEDFGAVNVFPSSIFSQGRLQVLMSTFAPARRKIFPAPQPMSLCGAGGAGGAGLQLSQD